MGITLLMLHHQGQHMAPSFLVPWAPTASKWATGKEKNAGFVLKAHSVMRAPLNLHPARRKQ